ncbi:MAG: RNA polymerase sigma factor [Ktedonobacteraceae bacterium]|jgi:RNA polymerase sigma-70 factor, ECF subfamily|nr:RNA polymerase sigma factor [Ktedonobacteraceae bacterium]
MDTQTPERTIQVQQEKTGNPTFEESWQQYYSHILAYTIRWVKNPQIAEDLTQTIFFCAWRAWSRLKSGSEIHNWLITIASNTIRNYFIHTQRKPWHSLEETLEETDTPLEIQADTDIEEGYLQQEAIQEIQKKVRDALDRIPEQFRQALLLFAEGYSHREIAEETGTPTGTALSRVYRGRTALAKELHKMEQPLIEVTCSERRDGCSTL